MPTVTSITSRTALLLTVAALAPASALAIPPGGGGGGDTTPPGTQIDSGPAANSYINTKTPSFTFSSNEEGGFECRVDNGGFAPCSSPEKLDALGDGTHTFYVRAVDKAQNIDLSPATRTFTVDTVAPTVGLTGPVNFARINDNTPTFTLSFSDATSSVSKQCKIDSGSWSLCSAGSYTPPALTDGMHTLYVRGTDQAQNQTAVDRTVVIDTKAPVPAIAGPDATEDTTPTFTFSAPHDGGGAYFYDCRLGLGTPVACNSGEYTSAGLIPGTYDFYVRATDSAGNESAFVKKTFVVNPIAVVPVPEGETKSETGSGGAPQQPAAGGATGTTTTATTTSTTTTSTQSGAASSTTPAAAPPALAAAVPAPRALAPAPKKAAKKKKAGCSRRALKALKTKKARRAAAKRCAAPKKRRK